MSGKGFNWYYFENWNVFRVCGITLVKASGHRRVCHTVQICGAETQKDARRRGAGKLESQTGGRMWEETFRCHPVSFLVTAWHIIGSLGDTQNTLTRLYYSLPVRKQRSLSRDLKDNKYSFHPARPELHFPALHFISRLIFSVWKVELSL